ncbi:hypothetical protein ACFY3M_36390 [Streptomyces mirabilis]|uniref:hypothetical protein n=1 Tax=Streptomyces mirabilis TaxID=68239 RepID=UPI0036823ED5
MAALLAEGVAGQVTAGGRAEYAAGDEGDLGAVPAQSVNGGGISAGARRAHRVGCRRRRPGPVSDPL